MNFDSTEAFVPATAPSPRRLVGGETIGQNMFYQVGASCTEAILYAGGRRRDLTASGIPGAQQRASDFHGSPFRR